MSPLSTTSKNKPIKSFAYYLLHADFSFSLFLGTEFGGDMFFRNVGQFSSKYMALYSRRQNSWFSLRLMTSSIFPDSGPLWTQVSSALSSLLSSSRVSDTSRPHRSTAVFQPRAATPSSRWFPECPGTRFNKFSHKVKLSLYLHQQPDYAELEAKKITRVATALMFHGSLTSLISTSRPIRSSLIGLS
jgi:hypothetical protein